jgi:ligand-binding sensor domain-containing protein
MSMKNISSQNKILIILTIVFLMSACNRGIKKDLPKSNEHSKLLKTPGNSNLSCGLQDKAGNLWFGTSIDGLYKYDGKSFSQYLVADGLVSNKISCLLEDKDGNLWIGTEEGLCFYDGKTFTEIQIPIISNMPSNTNQIPKHSGRVYSMMQAKNGALWFVTINGVFIYEGPSLSNEKASFTPFIINEAKNAFLGSNDKVEKILQDKAGNIWFGGRTNDGVFRYDGESITHLELPEITLQFETKTVIHKWAWPQVQAKNGDIWFSNWGGAYRYDGKTFTSFSKSDGLPGLNGLVAKIIEDKNGNLYFGGDAGLSRYNAGMNIEDGNEKKFSGFKNGLTNPWIWEIVEDKSGNIWVGTRDTGLYLFDGDIFINYSENK